MRRDCCGGTWHSQGRAACLAWGAAKGHAPADGADTQPSPAACAWRRRLAPDCLRACIRVAYSLWEGGWQAGSFEVRAPRWGAHASMATGASGWQLPILIHDKTETIVRLKQARGYLASAQPAGVAAARGCQPSAGRRAGGSARRAHAHRRAHERVHCWCNKKDGRGGRVRGGYVAAEMLCEARAVVANSPHAHLNEPVLALGRRCGRKHWRAAAAPVAGDQRRSSQPRRRAGCAPRPAPAAAPAAVTAAAAAVQPAAPAES